MRGEGEGQGPGAGAGHGGAAGGLQVSDGIQVIPWLRSGQEWEVAVSQAA